MAVNEFDREKAREITNRFNGGLQDDLIDLIVAALAEAREKVFHEGKEFAIFTIGKDMTSGQGQDVPFLAYSEATKALRRKSNV